MVVAGCRLAEGQASPVQASLVQASPGQASPVQTAPVQAVPVQTAPVQLPKEQATPILALGDSASAAPAQAASANAGGTIRGTVKAGTTPLPGVAVTATNTLTGKKYATTTDVNGAYAMTIPRTGRYVVRAELAAFASLTKEVRITAETADQVAEFGLELASRVAASAAAESGTQARALASAIGRGVQSLNLSGGEAVTDTTVGGGDAGAAVPSLGGLGADTAGAGADSVTFSGAQGQTNALAGLSEDDIRQRIEEAQTRARQQGGGASEQVDAIVGMLGSIMGGGGGGGGGGRGGGGRGGGGGGGRGGFGNFNPATPHGAVFYQGGFPALQAQASSAAALLALSTGTPFVTTEPNQSSQSNRFGVSFTGSPYIPGLFKADTKQFIFLNVTGVRNITPVDLNATVPTLAERNGDFSQATTTANGMQTPVSLYDPATGLPFAALMGGMPGQVIPMGRITPQAAALLALVPLPNVNGVTQNNYQEITTVGSNSTQGSLRYVRNFGQAGFGPFGGGGGGGGRRNANAPKTLRQNFNANFAFSRSANDLRNYIPILGGKSRTAGYNLSAGYTIGYGRLTNNSTVTWNRSHTTTLNFFTDGAVNPAVADGINVPTQAAQLPHAGFYNGVPNIGLTNFSSLSEQTPRDAVNQTISFSDFVSYSHKKHNMRYGVDVRRVHADQVGGNNVVGSFTFSGLSTESPADRSLVLGNNSAKSTTQASTGASLADLELGLPQETQIQAGLFKTYLRANVLDAYAQDDYRVKPGITLNYGLRWEYFSPYVEKNNRLVNLDTNANFTQVDPVQPGGTGTFAGAYPRSLVNPDRTMFSPRFGIAYRPKFLKETVIRAGYGINFNTGQFATFAQSLAFQPPFAVTQNNTLGTTLNPNGCVIEAPGQAPTLTLANGFGCSGKAITNTFAVNKNYRLGHVQVYNVDVQRSLPHGVVVNVGYNGSKGGDLDIVEAPNASVSSVTTSTAQAFTYENSVAASRLQQLVASARKRLEKGVSLQVVYQYSHSIDNASSIGGTGASTVQNSQRLDLEESNSSFDVRHRVTGNYVLELPFGPNRAFFNKGGKVSRVLDGFNVSGDFTFATGTYFTPQYQNAAAELAAGGTYTLRPDRVFSQPINGARRIGQWFNPAAFAAPANGYGTASRNSIEGPGTVAADVSLSRTFTLGSTRSFETRLAANNAFNTVQYSSIDTSLSSATFGQVNRTANQRTVTLLARYRF